MCYFPPDLPLTLNQPVSVTISSTKLILNGEEPLEIVLRVPWQYTQYVSMACVTTQIVVEEDDEADLHGQKGNGDNESDLEDDDGEKDGADGSKKGAGGDDERKHQKVGKQEQVKEEKKEEGTDHLLFVGVNGQTDKGWAILENPASNKGRYDSVSGAFKET